MLDINKDDDEQSIKDVTHAIGFRILRIDRA